jgi:uncharacterized protein YjlB
MVPPPELLKKWEDNWFDNEEHADFLLVNAYASGAQAGADQELEACCEWLQERINEGWNPCHLENLRTARRPAIESVPQEEADRG